MLGIALGLPSRITKAYPEGGLVSVGGEVGERLIGVGVGGKVDVGCGVLVRVGIGEMVGVQVDGRVMMIVVGVSVGSDTREGRVGGGNGFRILYGFVKTAIEKQATHRTPTNARIEKA